MEFKKEELLKNPFNYQGGKFKLLPQILPLFPNNIETFYDLFCGSGEVGINVNSKKLVLNDYNSEFLKMFKNITMENIECEFDTIINNYGLSKINKDGYLKLREDYNKTKDNKMLYMLLCHSFNNQISFNKNREFNVPFGMNRSSFNDSLRLKYRKYVEVIKSKNILFSDNSFLDFDINMIDNNDFVYIDCPYLITVGGYERDYKLKWSEELETKLLNLLDNINYIGIKFALSNVLEHKGKSNNILKEWSKKYNIHYLNHNYGNCNYQTKDKSKNSTIEVLITNY